MDEINYQSAKQELEEILHIIENEEVDIESLLLKVKRATELLNFCKMKLTKTEEELSIFLNSEQENKNSATTEDKN
jgi:exodeoxyribonuclease VII small subunit